MAQGSGEANLYRSWQLEPQVERSPSPLNKLLHCPRLCQQTFALTFKLQRPFKLQSAAIIAWKLHLQFAT